MIDPEEVRRAKTQVRQEQVQQGGEGTAPREGGEHQAAHHQASRQGQGRAQQRQVGDRGARKVGRAGGRGATS